MFKWANENQTAVIDVNSGQSYQKNSRFWRSHVTPYLDDGGKIESWRTSDEIEAEALSQEHAQKKHDRAAEVSEILIQISNGKIFHGNEESQDRIARAVTALQELSGNTLISWKLAEKHDGSKWSQVSRQELSEALILAGQKQTEIWEKYNGH